jgi:transcriptional regulator of acetoin/glycerol metabolism
VNETNYYALAAYRGHGWPPGHDNLAESALVGEAMRRSGGNISRAADWLGLSRLTVREKVKKYRL